MKRSLIIHLTDLPNGGQLNGRGKMTGGISTGVNCPGGSCPGALSTGGNCPGGNRWGYLSGEQLSKEEIVQGGCLGGNCPGGNCPVPMNKSLSVLDYSLNPGPIEKALLNKEKHSCKWSTIKYNSINTGTSEDVL